MEWAWIPRSNSEFLLGEVNTIFEKWGKSAGELKTDLLPQSEVFVREVVQNFMDAGDDPNVPKDTGVPELIFEFITVDGDTASRVASSLGLTQLSNRWTEYKAGGNAMSKMRDSKVLDGELTSYRLLVVREKNTSGMYGPWERSNKSVDSQGRKVFHKMRDALYATQRDTTANRAGRGSFGEGKKAIIGASLARTIFCYSAFDESSTEDNTSARFIGMAYWPNYLVDESTFTGLSVMGDRKVEAQTNIPLPLRNDAAHQFVADLELPAFPPRNLDTGLERGTSYLFVDPVITPEECLEALVRNWWPAIDRNKANFRVLVDGSELSIEEELDKRPELLPFRSLLDHSGDVDVDPDSWSIATSAAITTSEPVLGTCDGKKAGRMKLSLDLRPAVGFSNRDPDNNRTLICKIRDHMVIAYDTHVTEKDHPPFVRGLFEVEFADHPESQKLLRDTEPAVHNSWQTDKSYSSHASASHALAVRKTIKQGVEQLKEKYVRNMPYAELDLPLFREVLSVRGKSGKPPVPPAPIRTSPFSLRDISAKVVDVGDGKRKGVAKRSLQLHSVTEADDMQVQLSLSWERLGDRGQWDRWVPPTRTKIKALPDGFSMDPASGLISGLLTKDAVEFEFESEIYTELFTIRPLMTVLEATEALPLDEEESDES